MLFLFSVVRGDGLPYDRCQFTSNEGTRLLFHTRDGSTFGRKVISLMVVWNTLEQSKGIYHLAFVMVKTLDLGESTLDCVGALGRLCSGKTGIIFRRSVTAKTHRS